MFRFMAMGWIEDSYITPTFHFTYQYFDWVRPFDTSTMYAIVAICGISALCIGLGLFYRFTSILFFVSFTYLELIEKSWYLNHYYFVSIVAFLLLFLPAHRNYSLDVKWFKNMRLSIVPNWTIAVLRFQICLVYFFGGIAKLKYDWLIEAQPLTIWLKAKADLPFVGWLFEYNITPYIFSWSGLLFDLAIPFLLWRKQTRPYALVLVIIFHGLTFVLFNIGMFPWLMMFGSLIFVSADEWKYVLKCFHLKLPIYKSTIAFKTNKLIISFLALFIFAQILLPLRHFALTKNVSWTENGFRFAWHVMVMEKNGYAEFMVIDPNSGKRWVEYPSKNLTTIQEKQMSFQPDMIWQYAQFLQKKYQKRGFENCEVYVDCRVSLNGRRSQQYMNPKVNLANLKDVDAIYEYVLPLKD